MEKQENQSNSDAGVEIDTSKTTHYGLRRKKAKKAFEDKMASPSKDSSSGEYNQGNNEKLLNTKEDIGNTKSKEKKKKKSRKRKSKHTHSKHPETKKANTASGALEESEDNTQDESVNGEIQDHDLIKRNPGVVLIKEEVIDPEYERILLYSEANSVEDDPSEHVSFQEADEEDEFFPQTDEDEGSESAIESGIHFSDMGEEMPLIMEVKEEVDDQGYAVINQWNENTLFLKEGHPEEQEAIILGPDDIKKEVIEEDEESSNIYEYALKVPSNLEKFLLHKINFWVFHCPLCNSQQVFLHKYWLQQHFDEPFHKENGKMMPDAQELLQELLMSNEQYCPVDTCQAAIEGSIEDFCKHLIREHTDTFLYVRKLCQINVFCQENETKKETRYSLIVQVNDKWHSFFRTRDSPDIQTSIKDNRFVTITKNVDPPKMKMTVKVNRKPSIPITTIMAQPALAAPRDCSSFCFDDITYYKCPICPSLTVFFDILSLKTHMIKKSHQLSSVCRVLKAIGVQHPTHTCPVVNCNEDFGKSQKRQLKHILTDHPEKYETLKRLMDNSYQNFQSIAGIEGCIGGIQGLGIPNPQTINVTYKKGAKQLPTLKPKPVPSTSAFQNPLILGQLPQQSNMSVSQPPPTSNTAVFTSGQSSILPRSSIQIFPSSQTVRQILDSKMITKPRFTVDSGSGSSQNESTSEMNCSNDFRSFTGKNDSTIDVRKPRPVCYKCGVNALSNIGLISHLFSDHSNLICKICSFTAEPLKISNNIVNHMKDIHNIDSWELEENVCQSLHDICKTIDVSQLDGLSCITNEKFILDDLVVHYALVDAFSHKDKFEDDLIIRQVTMKGNEIWIEILSGQKHLESEALMVMSSHEDILPRGKIADDASEEENRNELTSLKAQLENKEIISVQNDITKPPTSNLLSTNTVKSMYTISQSVSGKDQDTVSSSKLSTCQSTSGLQADIDQVSPKSGYNSPIRRWLIQESIKEIRLERLPFANSLHCLRCHVTASTNRGFLLHIFSCHSIDVCKLCFHDLSKTNIKRVKDHLATHREYDRSQPIEDFLTLSCPEFMQFLGIPSLDQLCNITRDRIIFTFRVVWYRMAQVPFDTDGNNIMQKNLTVNSSPKAGTPDIILFFRNKHGAIIQVDKDSDSDATDSSFHIERNSRQVGLQNTKKDFAKQAYEENENNSSSSSSKNEKIVELESTRQFIEGKDFTIVLQGNDRVFKCLKCTRAYWNKCKMRRHLKVHLNIRNYQCHLCQKSFHYNYHLKAHMNIHNNSRPYKCNKCSKSYNNSGSLSWHVRQCHGLCNFAKNKVAKIQCQVCFIEVRQELYHEHLRERHGVSVAYQYSKSKVNHEEPEGTTTESEVDKANDGQDTEDDTSQDEFPWRGELIVDEGDGDEEPDNYDLAPTTAQSVFTLDDQEKKTVPREKYTREEVFQCTFCHIVFPNLSNLSMHPCLERPKKNRLSVSKKKKLHYSETYTCYKCKRTSLSLETFLDSSHPCALNSVNDFTCEKTYTCKLCQLIFTTLDDVHKHGCENADKQIEESEEEQEMESAVPQTESMCDLSADLTCPVCNGLFSMTDLPYHLSKIHHLNKKVVYELMNQDTLAKKEMTQ
ncbi:uncharacterized protein [Antedon mediterranea]|uniref:uncharacterized protein n=1 Tax=Antedon mediterranea TaxID=105859 RepID=UPI003AF5DAB7